MDVKHKYRGYKFSSINFTGYVDKQNYRPDKEKLGKLQCFRADGVYLYVGYFNQYFQINGIGIKSKFGYYGNRINYEVFGKWENGVLCEGLRQFKKCLYWN